MANSVTSSRNTERLVVALWGTVTEGFRGRVHALRRLPRAAAETLTHLCQVLVTVVLTGLRKDHINSKASGQHEVSKNNVQNTAQILPALFSIVSVDQARSPWEHTGAHQQTDLGAGKGGSRQHPR